MSFLRAFFHRVFALRDTILRGGWASLEALVGPAILFLLSPWLLHHLGSESFGIWLFSLAIAGFTSIVSLGAGVSTMYAIADRFARNGNNEIGSEIETGITLVLICSCFVLSFSWIVSHYVASSIFYQMGDQYIVRWAFLLGITALIIQEFDTVLAGALRGSGRFDLVGLFDLITKPLWGLAIACVASFSGDVIMALIIHNLFNICKLFARSFLLKKANKNFRIGLSFSLSNIKSFINYGKWISIQNFGGFLYLTADRFVVGWLFGSSDLVRYSLCLQIVQFIHNLQSSAFQIITPWIMKFRASKATWAELNIVRFTVIAGVSATIFPLIVILFSYNILDIWIGPIFAENNQKILVVLLMGGAILAFTVPMHYVVLGLGNVKYGAQLLVAAGIASIASSFLLSFLGLVGFALGRSTYGAIACLYFVPIYRSRLGEKVHG